METAVNLICHGHPLTISSGFAFRCYWCKTGGYISNGYNCTKCDRWFHKECANYKFSWKINHTSHPEHPLEHTYNAKRRMCMCRVCKGLINDDWAYYCHLCPNFSLHASCAIESPRLTIKHLQAHEHPLFLFQVSRNQEHLCEVCKGNFIGDLGYRCFECEVIIHVECVNPLEVNHPCHPKHSLTLITSGAPDYTDNTCLLCGLKLEGILYHCSICNFSVCLGCACIPPPTDVKHLKTHEHKLTLMARQISFTCNACGMQGDRSPYICLQCDFVVHRSCIGFPHVININRHDHHLSYTQKLSFGVTICKICLQCINRFYGAYSCLMCNYVVHLQCATKNDVWDGIELEGLIVETEDITSFKEVGDNLINHFSHEKHNLKLNKDGNTHGGSISCEACMLPVYSDSIYSCQQCGFVLHEICAKLPRKKQHMFHNKPFTLHVGNIDSLEILRCNACYELFNGFRYESEHVVLDVRCILTSELFFSTNHVHPMHYNKIYNGKCDACDISETTSGAFSCRSCDYNIDYRCASLPQRIKHKCDQHFLFLSCKENASEKYWCDICEEEIDPNKWFYTCNDCEIFLHVKCGFGDFSRLKPGQVFVFQEERFVKIPNNHSSRPICMQCKLRCKAPFIIKDCDMNKFICSERCFLSHTVILMVGHLIGFRLY